MATYRDDAIVLRTHKLGEADRIITLLTKHNGKIRAVAKGIRRTKSRFGARLEPFNQVDVQLYEGRNLDTVTQVETIRALGGDLVTQYPKFTAGQVIVETVDKLVSEERQPMLAQYQLALGSLRTIVEGTWDGPRPASMILNSYLLRALAVSGYAINLAECVNCAQKTGLNWFSASAGGLVCENCRPIGATKIAPDETRYLICLFRGDWPGTRSVSSIAAQRVSELVEQFTNWHLEHTLKSLPMLDRSFNIETK